MRENWLIFSANSFLSQNQASEVSVGGEGRIQVPIKILELKNTSECQNQNNKTFRLTVMSASVQPWLKKKKTDSPNISEASH